MDLPPVFQDSKSPMPQLQYLAKEKKKKVYTFQEAMGSAGPANSKTPEIKVNAMYLETGNRAVVLADG